MVLGGGGLAGIAWHVGILLGLSEGGLHVDRADLIVGTSAGSTVAAQLAWGLPLAGCFERQVDPALQNQELRPTGMSVTDFWDTMAGLMRRSTTPRASSPDRVDGPGRRHRARTGPSGRGGAAAPFRPWPDRRMATVAVDAATGQRRMFDRDSGVGLVDAVAACSAVPGIWPPVTIGEVRYVDGGIYSSCNADLVVGYDRVLVLAPMVDPALTGQVAAVEASGRAAVVSPDEASLAAFTTDALDPGGARPLGRPAVGRRRCRRFPRGPLEDGLDRRVADGLDVVAVGVADEGPEVGGADSGHTRGACSTSAPAATAMSKKDRTASRSAATKARWHSRNPSPVVRGPSQKVGRGGVPNPMAGSARTRRPPSGGGRPRRRRSSPGRRRTGCRRGRSSIHRAAPAIRRGRESGAGGPTPRSPSPPVGSDMATRVVATASGDPRCWRWWRKPVPDPGPGQVSVEVRAVGTNPVDYKLFSGEFGR